MSIASRTIRALLLGNLRASSPLFAALSVGAQQVEQGVAIVSETIASRVDGFSSAAPTARRSWISWAPHWRRARKARCESPSRATKHKSKVSSRDCRTLGPSVPMSFPYCVGGHSRGPGHQHRHVRPRWRPRQDRVGNAAVSFALIATAEPHFAVSIPSKFIVMQNFGKKGIKGVKVDVTSLASREDYSSRSNPSRPIPNIPCRSSSPWRATR